MVSFAQTVSRFRVPAGKIGVFWLGQAGFIFKTPDNVLAALDPYLSDCCKRYVGFRRMMTKLMQPYDLIFDVLLVSHAHYDHFDVDAAPMMMDNEITSMVAACDVKPECRKLGMDKCDVTYLHAGDAAERCGIKIIAAPCDHGKDTPDAIGFVLKFGGKKVYFAGDTAFRPDFWADPELSNADLFLPPINGAYGNLDAGQAVKAAEILTPRLTVPCHFGNFAEHGGSPLEFQRIATEVPITFRTMRQGEGILI